MILNLKILDLIKKQFKSKEKNSPKIPLIREALEDHKISYEEINTWYTNEAKQIGTEIYDGYQKFLEKKPYPKYLNFHNENGINALSLDITPAKISFDQCRKLMTYISLSLKEKKYVIHLNEVSTDTKADTINCNYRYYLKPSHKLMTQLPAKQLYGNITIELKLKNDLPHRLLLKANYYSDHNYQEPESYNSMLEYLFVK
jgi:hypothetical protein